MPFARIARWARIRTPLFGYREELAQEFNELDPDWVQWFAAYHHFHIDTQTKGLGGRLNRAGYRIVTRFNFASKMVLEIGPGTLPHRSLWQGTPKNYISVEVDPKFHSYAERISACDFTALTRGRNDPTLAVPDGSVDYILTFYSLEHLRDLDEHLIEFSRVLKPGGRVIGAVPNEGGLAWGLGRFLVTRRWVKRNYGIDYDKIIAWEHPNYVDAIRQGLSKHFDEEIWDQRPFGLVRNLNLNLISRFSFIKN